MDYSMIGPVLVLTLACIGSSMSCCIAGMASHGAMTHVDEGHGKFIGLSAMPASQSIYGFLLMLLMKNAIKAGTLSPISGIAIGLFVGIALLLSSYYQGKAAATAIQASAKQPAISGKTWAAVTIIESISLFVFVFALQLLK